jgi:MFS transporter, PAT family, beta-lactamase induction signal transducer AmpG
LLFTGTAFSSLGGSALGAVLAAIPEELRGRASGCYQLGNIAAGAVGGAACIALGGAIGGFALAAAVAAFVFLPALAAHRIIEVPLPRMPALALFSALARDVRDVVWSWRALVGVLFCCSPVGAGALINLISSLAPDFHAPSGEVAWVTGLGGGLLLGLGSLVGGQVCDRIDRRMAYALFGISAGGFAAWMALGPKTPWLYGVGYAGYALSTGLSYAGFTSLVLDILGPGRRAAATGFSLFGSLGNLPVSYMTWLDGVGYKQNNARGLVGVDAAANITGGLLLLLLARLSARRWNAAAVESTAKLG